MIAVDHSDSFQSTTDGFTIEEFGQPVEFRDSEVVGLRMEKQHRLTSGSGGNVRQRLEIRVRRASDERTVAVSDDFERLKPFYDRLQEDLLVRSLEEMRSGGEACGPGWKVTMTTCTDQNSGRTVEMGDLSAAGWDGDEFVVWLNSGETFARYSRDAENTYLLERIMSFFVEKPAATLGSQDEGLGQLVSELEDSTPMTQNIMGGIAVVGFIGAWVWYRVAPALDLTFWIVLGAIAAGTACCLAAVYALVGKKQKLLHFENALVFRNDSGETILPWHELESFTAEWTDQYYNGAYTGTVIKLCCQSENVTIRHDTSASNKNEKYARLERLHAHATQVVEKRIKEELRRNGRVQWTPKLAITRSGIEYAKRPESEPALYEYNRISKWDMKNGKLKIWIDGNRTASITAASKDVNFFPGLSVVESMATAAYPASDEESQQPVLA